jgi:DNA-directed RNA polymerase subunit RPC12/RpoP
METLSVRCNHCGAPLQVASNTRFVTCQFCGSSLEVKRTESSIFTEEVAKIAENTGRMAESLNVIALQNEIEKLDREVGLSHVSSSNTKGRGLAGGVLGGAFGILFAVVCFLMATGFDKAGTGVFTIVPIGMGVFGLVVAGAAFFGSVNHEAARSNYQKRRAELESTLEELKRR